MIFNPRLLGVTAIMAFSGWQMPALAALGGDLRSVSSDKELMQGSLQTTPMQQYDLHEISTSGGTLIHEYMTPQGKVFAISWRGPFPPNLQQLFGGYYTQYQRAAAANAAPGNHRMLNVHQSDFVIQAVGRMRAYHGKAYIPSLVPTGVSVATLP